MAKDNNREFYCFISYKHRDGDKFVIDDKWSALIAHCLESLYIPTQNPPADEAFICLNPKDERVSPVFRDFDVLTSNEFTPKIEEGLQQSRYLVVILSQEMIENQENQLLMWRKNTGKDNDLNQFNDTEWGCVYEEAEAWCYREIHKFLKYKTEMQPNVDNRRQIILVYIGERERDHTMILPRPLTHHIHITEQDGEKKDLLFDEDKSSNSEYLGEIAYWKERNII